MNMKEFIEIFQVTKADNNYAQIITNDNRYYLVQSVQILNDTVYFFNWGRIIGHAKISDIMEILKEEKK